MLLAAVADDLTGATDIALAFSRQGLSTVQINGVPDAGTDDFGADAVVIALKSRTIPAEDAVAQSRAAAEWLVERGAGQIVFKYCSTFDSTDEGNIGPVTDALLMVLDEKITIACPAFPENGRTMVHGHLFVGHDLLSDSSMKNHPLTPMTDSDIVRVLKRQSAQKVALLPHDIVRQGASAISTSLDEHISDGVRILVADALYHDDLANLAEAFRDRRLLTGAASIGGASARILARELGRTPGNATIMPPAGDTLVIAGSCSEATRGQIKHVLGLGYPAFKVDPDAILSTDVTPADVIGWAVSHRSQTPVVYSSTDPGEVAASQERLGRDKAGQVVEEFFSELARLARAAGFSRMMVAGGETSGAVVRGLGGKVLHIGPEIDPGVPWTMLRGDSDTALALKSGNFGTTDFFVKAGAMLS